MDPLELHTDSDELSSGEDRGSQHPSSVVSASTPHPQQPPLSESVAEERGNEVPLLAGGWRDTVEYRAAWDLEVWKAVQAERFRKQLERHKADALAELSNRIKRKEKEELAAMQVRAEQLEIREEQLRQEADRQQQQKRRLEEAERDLTKARHQLLEAQKRVEEEIRVQIRRANEDFEHKSVLLREQVRASEEQRQRLEERLRQSEADYLHLFEEFHRFKTEHVTGTGKTGHSVESIVNSEIQMMHARHTEEMRLLQERLEQKAHHQIEDLQKRCQTLEFHNKRLTAALARRREQLRHHARGGGSSSTPQAAEDPPRIAAIETGTRMQEPPDKKWIALLVEMDRLQRERSRLVEESGGALGDGDPVLDALDRQIALLDAKRRSGATRCTDTARHRQLDY
eukprot:gene11244-7812_t